MEQKNLESFKEALRLTGGAGKPGLASVYGTCDMEYPYGSCQYVPVRRGYLAAKEVGPQNLGFLFDEAEFYRALALKGKKEEMLEKMGSGITSCLDEEDAEEGYVAEIQEIETMDGFYQWMAEHSWDLWSAVHPVPEINHPDFKNMDGVCTGVQMALTEYLWEEEINFNEWDT